MMKLHSLALTEDEQYDYHTPISTPDRPEFPWETRLTLTDKTMAKLGIDPEEAVGGVGGTVMIHAMARITSASIDQRDGGEPCARVELQIESMAIDGDEAEEAPKRGLASIYKS